MLESSVEEYFRTEVEKAGGRAEKLVDLTRIGHPDREVQWPFRSHPTRGCGIDKVELKKPGETPKAHQTRYHEYLARCGIPVYLIDTKAKVDLYVATRVAGLHVPRMFSVPCDDIGSW